MHASTVDPIAPIADTVGEWSMVESPIGKHRGLVGDLEEVAESATDRFRVPCKVLVSDDRGVRDSLERVLH